MRTIDGKTLVNRYTMEVANSWYLYSACGYALNVFDAIAQPLAEVRKPYAGHDLSAM